jgi:hypothetical protein
MSHWSLHPLVRIQTGWPAGTSEIAPGGGWDVPRYPLIAQGEGVRRLDKQDELVVGQGGLDVFRGGQRAVARRLQADPAQPVTRRRRHVGEAPAPVQGPDLVAAPRLFFSHHLRLPDESGRGHRRIVLRSA